MIPAAGHQEIADVWAAPLPREGVGALLVVSKVWAPLRW